jgi:hypothetical protein
MEVKESKEALVALVVLGKAVAELAKDGLDLSDGLALGSKFIADEKFRAAVVEGIKGIDKVGPELKDIAASEALELLGAIYEELKK